jgi:acyl-CoA thioester hydrolase
MTSAGADLPPQGRLDGVEHRLPIRVYYEDTDVSGVAYHATYLRWMERARTEMLRVAGIDHGGWVAAGEGGYAVASLAIRYRGPARLDDALTIATRLTGVRAASLAIQQTVRRGAVVLAQADVVAALLARDGRPRRQPRAWLAIYRGLLPDHQRGAGGSQGDA